MNWLTMPQVRHASTHAPTTARALNSPLTALHLSRVRSLSILSHRRIAAAVIAPPAPPSPPSTSLVTLARMSSSAISRIIAAGK